MGWKKHGSKLLLALLIATMLAGAYWYGGNAPGMQGWSAIHRHGGAQNSEQAAQRAEAPLPSGGHATPLPSTAPAGTPSHAQAAGHAASPPSIPSEMTEENRTPFPGLESKNTSSDAILPTESNEPTPPSLPSPVAGDRSDGARPGVETGSMTVPEKFDAAGPMAGESPPVTAAGDKLYSESHGMVIDPDTGKDQYLTDPVPDGKPLPVEPQAAVISDKAHTCTLSISCAAILNHMDWLDQEKVELVPDEGWILEPAAVTFYEGESVFNVLQRTCKQKNIHMEFENTPMYNSAYIEGIHNLYEFDCGELSGWMYKVNGWFPNYGCSRYQLMDGDAISWEFTCDLGVDIGGFYAIGK